VTGQERLLQVDMIPDSLWDSRNGHLLLPPCLADAFREAIMTHGLTELSRQRDRDSPPVGGFSQEETDKHFAQAFDGSVARVGLAVLDPKGEVSQISDALIRCLAGNELCIVDAPCGAGAATLSFLSAIAELRQRGVLPRQPMDVKLIGAELSGPARLRAAEMLSRVRNTLESEAIIVTEEFLTWDVTSSLSNTDLIQRMILKSQGAMKILLVVANFNAFLERGGKKKESLPQLTELLRHASSRSGNLGIWIEPNMNCVVEEGKLFSWIIEQCMTVWRSFVRFVGGSETQSLTTSSKFLDPIDGDSTPRVQLAVLQLELERQP